MENKIISELEIIEEAIKDWRNGILSDMSAFIAIKMTVTDNEISKECREWDFKTLKDRGEI